MWLSKVNLSLIIFAIVFANCVVQSHYYLKIPHHIYLLDDTGSYPEVQHETRSLEKEFVSREEESGEDESDESIEEKHGPTKGHVRRRPLHHGDFGNTDGEDDNDYPETRLLFPFSIKISKGKPGWGQDDHYNDGGHGGGWGWDHHSEHEKHRLKYEIMRLKAKKKIAFLEKNLELSKLLTVLIHKKAQSLDWWR